MNSISSEICVCIRARRSSTFSILPESSPVSLYCSSVVPNWLIRRSRSFSCSFRTFIMKSNASRASSLDGFFDMFVPLLA